MTDEPVEIAAETLPTVAAEGERTEGNRIVPNVSEAIPADEVARITTDLIGALKTVYDPEIPADIYELGLIYGVDVEPDGEVQIQMTLTAPACPVAGMLVKEVADKSGTVEGVATSHVALVWDPPWTKERMSEDALLELGMLSGLFGAPTAGGAHRGSQQSNSGDALRYPPRPALRPRGPRR